MAAIAAATALRRRVRAAGGGGETGSEDATDAGTSEGACGGEDQDYTGETLTVWIMEGGNPERRGLLRRAEDGLQGADRCRPRTPDAAVGRGARQVRDLDRRHFSTPDVAEVGTTWVPEFAEVGALAPLDDLVACAGLADKMVEGRNDSGTTAG
ncbi:hypothetical protein [Salana multivorans]